MYSFISGAVMMGCWVVSLFFYRFWWKTADRLFQIFSFAFFLLGLERMIPVVLQIDEQPRTFIYVIRLLAFILILMGIIHKNRGLKPH